MIVLLSFCVIWTLWVLNCDRQGFTSWNPIFISYLFVSSLLVLKIGQCPLKLQTLNWNLLLTHSNWLIGAVSEAGFWRTSVIFHDNMSDTYQAINGSVSIFLRVPSFELVMQRFGPVLWLFFPHRLCELTDFVKTTWRRTGIYNASLAS